MKIFLTKRERACIALRIPESGTPWLDTLITKAQLRDTSTALMSAMGAVMWSELALRS